MGSAQRRLDRVEDALTPTEAVVLWLREAQEFGSFREYVLWLVDQPDASYPLFRLPNQVETAVRTARHREAKDTVNREVRTAVRDLAFRFFLTVQVNTHALQERRAWYLQHRLLLSQLRLLDWNGPPVSPDWIRWTEQAMSHRLELAIFASAAGAISRRFFAGTAVLFPDLEDDLQFLNDQTGQILDLVESQIDGADDGRAVDAESAMPDLVQAASEKLVRSFVDLARAEALVAIGEQSSAYELARSRVTTGAEWP